MSRDIDANELIVRGESSFQDNKINDVADGTELTDAVNLQQLNAVAVGQGWDEATFDDSTGDLKFLITSVLNETVNLDGRYLTTAEVQALIDAQGTGAFKISLGSGSTVQDRIDAAISVPSGWTLTASGLNLIVTHNLSRMIADVTVWTDTTLGSFQKLLNTAAFSGLVADADGIIIQSLATITRDINIYVIFGE